MSFRSLGFLVLVACLGLVVGCTAAPSCEVDNGGCAVEAACAVAGDTVSCTCKRGFEGDGRTCVDVDECPLMDCGPNMTCRNAPGSAACECLAGFTPGDEGCVDVDECATNPCQVNAACTNTEGAYECACKAGYKAEGTACVDVDECAAGTDDCGDHATCSNADGAFSCTCAAGYVGDGRRCDPSVLAGTARFFGNVETMHAESMPTCVRRLASGDLLFAQDAEGVGRELHRLRAGAVSLVRDIEPGPNPGVDACLDEVAPNRLLFIARQGAATALWQTDGTAGGTGPVCTPGASGPCPASLRPAWTRFGDRYLLAEDTGLTRTLWQYDPATNRLTTFAAGLSTSFQNLGQAREVAPRRLVLCDGSRQLSLDENGVVNQIRGADNAAVPCGSARSLAPAILGDRAIYLRRPRSTDPASFFVTDGGTTATLAPWTFHVASLELVALGGKVYFVGRTTALASDDRLYEWDGDLTHAPTTVVASTPAGPSSVRPANVLGPAGARLLFAGYRDGSADLDLFSLTPSAGLEWLASTPLKPTAWAIDPAPTIDSGASSLVRLATTSTEIGSPDPGTTWAVTDGTPAGTRLFAAGPDAHEAVSTPTGFVVAARLGTNPAGLVDWSRASPTSLSFLAGVTGPENGSYARLEGRVGGRMIYSQNKGAEKVLMASSDDAATGVVVSDRASGCARLLPGLTATVGAHLYFVCAASVSSFFTAREIWRTDGTRAGTTRVTSEPLDVVNGLHAWNGKLFVQRRGGVTGTSALGVFDPTTGTYRPQLAAVDVRRFRHGSATELFFWGDSPVTGRELWRTDGTEAGTTMVVDLSLGTAGTGVVTVGVTATGRAIICLKPATGDASLSVLDPGASTPVPYFTAPGLVCDDAPTSEPGLSNGRFVVMASSDATGSEPLVTDGTTAGTAFLDLVPGGDGSDIDALLVNPRAARFLFVREVGDVQALFESDGTTAGTRRVDGLLATGSVDDVAVMGRGVIFLADADGDGLVESLHAYEDGVSRPIPIDLRGQPSTDLGALTTAGGRAFVLGDFGAIGTEPVLFSMAE
jgi:ELWxxDGT repeat protein